MEESEPSDNFLEALNEVTNRLSSVKVHVEELQSELDEKYRAFQVGSQVAASRIQMQANAAIGSQDQVCINAALVNIERRKRTYLKVKRAKVSEMRRLQMDIDDFHKAILNDLILKMDIETMMDIAGCVQQLREFTFEEATSDTNVIDLTGDSDEEDSAESTNGDAEKAEDVTV